MKTIRIYDTQAAIDGANMQEALRVKTLAMVLSARGADVKVVPMEEVVEPEPALKAILEEKADEALPCMTVDGQMWLVGNYPANEALMMALEAGESVLRAPINLSCAGSCDKCGGCN